MTTADVKRKRAVIDAKVRAEFESFSSKLSPDAKRRLRIEAARQGLPDYWVLDQFIKKHFKLK